MKRLATFALLGPPLGLFAIALIVEPLWNGRIMPIPGAFGLLLYLAAAYFFGLIPALFACAFDSALKTFFQRPVRALLMLGIGFGIGLITFKAIASHQATYRDIWFGGIVGALPSFICSWLAGTFPQQQQPEKP